MRNLLQTKATPTESRCILTGLASLSPPLRLPVLNKRLQRGLRSLVTEPGVSGLLQRDSCVHLDKLHLEVEEGSSSSVSSSGSCGYLQPRFSQGSLGAYEGELRRQVESKELRRTHIAHSAACLL